MTRLFLVLTALAVLLMIAPAAPVPRDAEPVLYFPTKVGAGCVCDRNGVEETAVVTKVERKGDGWLVTREAVEADGRRQPEGEDPRQPRGDARVRP